MTGSGVRVVTVSGKAAGSRASWSLAAGSVLSNKSGFAGTNDSCDPAPQTDTPHHGGGQHGQGGHHGGGHHGQGGPAAGPGLRAQASGRRLWESGVWDCWDLLGHLTHTALK